MNLFTPYLGQDDYRRAAIQLTDADYRQVSRGRWGPHRFTDQLTGTVFLAQGASCGAGRCYCAAEIVSIERRGTGDLAVFNG